MTYEMKDFQEDEKTLRKQAKDGEISEEEFFIAIRKLHNRATEGEAKANELSPEAQCPNCGSYKTILEGKSSLGYGKRKQYVCQNCYNVFQSEHSPKEIRAMYRDGTSPYDRNRWGYFRESKATEDYVGKCKRCGQTKELTNTAGTWRNALSDQQYPDGNIPSPTCEDCYYDIYGEPDFVEESKASEDFKEDDHPREEDGKFAKKGSGSSSGGKSKTAMRKERTRSLVKSNLNDSQRKTLDRFFDNNKMGMPKFDSIRSAGKDWDMKKDLTQTQVKELEGVDKSDILDYLKKRIASKDQWHKDADVRNEKQAKQDKIDSRKRKKRQRELEKHEKEVEQRLERREKYISENPELMKGQTRDAINQLNKPQKARIEDLANRYRKDNYLSSEDEREDLANVIDMMDDYGTLDDYTDKELELVLFFATARMKNNLDNYDNKDQVLYSKMMDIYNSSDFVEESKATERRGVWEIPNFWHGREPDEDTMKDYERVESLGIENGDLVDFGSYGKLYVLSTDYGAGWGSDSLDMWVTEDEEDRFNPEARGNSIGPYHAVSVIEKGSSVDMEDFKNKFTEDEDDDYYGESKANEDMIYDENGIWQPKPEERIFSNGNVMALRDHYEELEGYKSHEGGVTLCKICNTYFDTYVEFSTHYQTHSKKEQGMENESNANEEFKEDEHPRDNDGQFTSKGSGSTGGSTKDDKPKGKRVVGVTQYSEEDSKRFGRMFRKFPTDKMFAGSKGHLIADSWSDHWDSQNSYGANIIVGGKVNKAHTKMNSLISKYRKLKTDDNDKPLDYSKGSALLKEMEEYENKAFEELQKINKNRDLVKDGHWVISDDLSGSRQHSHLELVKGSKYYPKKTMEQGYADSEFRAYDFELNDKKMVKVGDTIGLGYPSTQILVTGFEYGDEDHDGISIEGIIQDRPSGTFRNVEGWELGDDRKGTKIHTQIDRGTRLVKDGGLKMVGESKANEMGSWQGVEHWWNGITENDRDSIIGTIVGQKVVSKWGLHDLRTMKWNDIPSDARLLLEAQIEGWDTSQYSVMEESKEEDDKLQKSVMSMYPTKQDVEDRYNARNEESNANEGKTCQACGGYGEIKKGGSKEWEDCPKCGGSGEIGSESRHHEQINVEKKWLERCEVCGDIRASHTNGIDHKFEVDATGTEFLDPKYLNGLGESALFKKNISVEMVRLSTMREAHTWWDRKHAGTYGRKYWKDMNIRERQKVILAYLKTVTGFGGGIPLVESRARGVRKYALESKRVKFENPDPKFWWNDGEARTGTVLNEYKQSGLEWYSVNSGGQLYNILKNDAELIASEHDPSEEDLGFKRCPECGILLNDHRMRNHFENEHNTFINEYLWKDNLYLVENDHRNYSAIESDEEAQALLTDVTELGLLNDLKDNEESEQEKGEDEAEDLDLIEQLMDIEEDEIKEKIEEATPNSLIRYANPRKLPNGKTIMDRVRTSHPQVNEHHLHNPLHISKHHQGDFSVTQICTECGQVIKGDPITVDEASIKHVNETGHNSFSVKVDESIDILGNIPFEAISTMAWNNLSPVIKEKIKAKISKEYWNDGTLNTTGEWWDLQDYGFKWTTLSNLGFAKSDELAKAYWTHLPMNVQNVVKRYRGIHFPDVLGLEGKQIQIGHKNHNIHKYLDKSLQDYLSGNKSDNDEYDELRNVSDAEWESTGHPREDDGKFKAKEDSLIKIEDNKDDNTQVTVLDEWKNETHPDKNGKTKGIRTTKSVEGDLENLIDMYSDTTQMPRGFIQNPSEPLGSADSIEECPFCGKGFDEFNLDFHVEQEHGVHTPSQYTQSTIMDNLDDEWLGEAWDKMSAKERRKLLGESKVECSRCGERFDEENTEGMKRHEEGRHTQQKSASTNYDYGKVEWVPLGTYKPLYESKANEIGWGNQWWHTDRQPSEIFVPNPDKSLEDHFTKKAYSDVVTCKHCGIEFELTNGKSDFTILNDHILNDHDIVREAKASEFEKNIWDDLPENPTKSQIKKAIRKLQDFIYYASIENPMHMGEFESRLKDLKEKLESYESKATEGGFGSGRKGHSAWMKDIEWGGNYKQCPICNINTNFTSGKCEICGNSFA